MAGEIIVNTPRETTMQDIAAALKSIAFSQAAKQENISDWAQLSGLSRKNCLISEIRSMKHGQTLQ